MLMYSFGQNDVSNCPIYLKFRIIKNIIIFWLFAFNLKPKVSPKYEHVRFYDNIVLVLQSQDITNLKLFFFTSFPNNDTLLSHSTGKRVASL
jgi:hypothetical protein